MSEKLEVEIIDSGDGDARSLSPEDFATVREFNQVLARMKAAARAKEFEESQDLKARKKIVKDQKMIFDEEKAVKKKEIEQTRLTVQEMKAKRQLDVVIGQQQRAREAEINKRDRHREMMLRHVLGAINPNSTFQYRMSSIYGLLNTAGITSQRDVTRVPGQGEGVQQKVGNVLQSLSDGLKTLFGQSGSFFRGVQTKGVSPQGVTSSPITNIGGMAKETVTSVSPPEEDKPWWWDVKPKGFKPTERDRMKSMAQMLTGEYQPLRIKSNIPQLQPANIKMAVPVQPGGGGMGGVGGGSPPIGGSPAGAGGGGTNIGSFLPGMSMLGAALGTLAVVGAVAYGFKVLYDATNALSKRFAMAGDDIRIWSKDLIMSRVQSNLRMMQFGMERADKFGVELSNFEQSRTSLDMALTRLGDSLTMPFLPLVTQATKSLSAILDAMSVLTDIGVGLATGRIFENVTLTTGQVQSIGAFLNIFMDGLWIMTGGKPSSSLKGFGSDSASIDDMAKSLASFLNMPIPTGTDASTKFSFQGIR